MKSQTVIIDTESLAGMIRQEVKAAISPLILAINNSEYQQLPELCTKAAAARYLGVHVSTIARYIKRGRLREIGGKVVKGSLVKKG